MADAQTQKNNEKVGQIGASFLSGTPSVRLMGLGGNQAALGGGVETVFSNPAGMTDLEISELYFSHNESFFDTQYDSLFFGIPLKSHVLSLGAQYINDGEADRIGEGINNNPITNLGQFKFATRALHLSWAKAVGKRIDFGATAKGWSDQRDGQTEEGWATDFGIRLRSVFPSLDIGVTQRNLGPSFDGKKLPRSLAIGTAYHYFLNQPYNHRVSFSSELDFPKYQKAIARVGLEYNQRYFSVRGGFQNATDDLEESLTQFSFGGGLRINGWKLDYTWVPRGELDDEHRVAFSIGIGLTKEQRMANARKLDLAMEKRVKQRVDTLFFEGKKAMNLGQWKHAVGLFEQAIEWDPTHTEASNQLKMAKTKYNLHQASLSFEEGTRLAKNKDWLEASLMWEKTLTYNPHHEEAKAKLKRSKMIINRRVDLALEESDATKRYHEGVDLFIKGKPQEALGLWEEAVKINPNIPNIKEYIEKAKRITAEKKLASLEVKDENKTKTINRLAHEAFTLYTLGHTKSAIKLWKEIVILDPNNKEASHALKDAQEKEHLVKGKEKKSRHKKAIELNVKALTAYAKDDYETSIRIWRQALRLDPTNKWIKNNLKRVELEIAQDPKRISK